MVKERNNLGLRALFSYNNMCHLVWSHNVLYFLSNLRQNLESLEVNVEMEKKNQIIKKKVDRFSNILGMSEAEHVKKLPILLPHLMFIA